MQVLASWSLEKFVVGGGRWPAAADRLTASLSVSLSLWAPYYGSSFPLYSLFSVLFPLAVAHIIFNDFSL